MKKSYCVFLFLGISFLLVWPKSGFSQDSLPPKEKKIVAFPAISYTPETQLTLGVVGFYFIDFSHEQAGTRTSYIRPIVLFTTAKQVILETEWELFTFQENWVMRGILGYRDFPARNYGLTASADEWVTEYDSETQATDTLNYLRYTSKSLYFRPVVLRKIGQGIYAGLQLDLTYQYNYSRLADSVAVGPQQAPSILGLEAQAMQGFRAGVGVNLTFDNRDQAVSPYRGSFLQVFSYHYGTWLGADFSFNTFTLDLRHYLSPFKKRADVIAIRGLGVFSSGTSDQFVPVNALGEIGGRRQVMGYFRNTFLGNQTLIFQAEYRAHIWKFLGLSAIIGSANAFANFEDPAWGQFRTALGLGLRLRLNEAKRTFLRVDFARGLYVNPITDKPQSGLYFSMGESF